MSERKVPELSLLSYINGDQTQKAKFCDDLYLGLVEYGFIILKDHPVSQTTIDKAYSYVSKFFALSTETKEKYISKEGGGQRGFTSFGKEHAKDCDAPDLKEFWHVGRELSKGHRYENDYPQNIWPDQDITGFKELFQKFYQDMDETSQILLEALTSSLKLEKDFFNTFAGDGNSILRLIHYPPVDPKQVEAGSVRAAAHGDINLITMLVGATDGGLQLQERDGSWLDVATRPGEIVVDAGDMLSRLTNEVIPSTIHRVINPPGDKLDTTRFSMPFFVHPNPDSVISCLESCKGDGAKFEDITSQEFLMQRLKDIGLM